MLPPRSVSPLDPREARRKRLLHLTLMTDEARQYTEIGKDFADHQSVNHSAKEYVRGDAHTNTVEGFYLYAACMACISTAARITCIATLPTSTSATTTDRNSDWVKTAQLRHSKASAASA
jgi:hypothetical protein